MRFKKFNQEEITTLQQNHLSHDTKVRKNYESKRKSPRTLAETGYKLNSFGFRCDDFEKLENADKIFIFVGCSFTFGTGLKLEDTWAYKAYGLLKNQFPEQKIPFINLSQPGRGLSFMVEVISNFAEQFNISKIDGIFAVIPSFHRLQISKKNKNDAVFGAHVFIKNLDRSAEANKASFEEIAKEKLMTAILADDEFCIDLNSMLLNWLCCLSQAKQCDNLWIGLCESCEVVPEIKNGIFNKTKIKDKIFSENIFSSAYCEDDFASDLSHPGFHQHDMIVNSLIEIIQEKIGKK